MGTNSFSQCLPMQWSSPLHFINKNKSYIYGFDKKYSLLKVRECAMAMKSLIKKLSYNTLHLAPHQNLAA